MNPLLDEIVAEQGLHIKQKHPDPLIFVLTNCWIVIVAMFLAYHVWKHIYLTLAAERMRDLGDQTAHVLKEEEDPLDVVKREEERMAAVENFQKRYDEDILKMKKMDEEKEKMRREKYVSRFPEISPGRKLNESCDDVDETGEPNAETHPADNSGNEQIF